MDDQRFDDIIKNKVGEYTDPVFDESAISGLHQHLAAHQVLPWYAAHKTAGVMAATLALFTLINWLMIRNTGNSELNQAGITNNGNYETLIGDLRDELNRLQSVGPDTVFVVNQRVTVPTTLNASADEKITPDEVINTFLLRLKDGDHIGKIGDYYFYHEDDLPSNTAFIALNNQESALIGSNLSMSYPTEDTLYKDIILPIESEEQSKMPLIVIRDLEKHYSKGVGLKFGPVLELANTKPKIGGGEILPGGGLLGEIVFSPSLGLETGFVYKTRSYDQDSLTSESLTAFPDVDNSLGVVNELEGDAKLLEIPVNLKYYSTIAQNKDLYLSVGVSPNIYLSQEFEYSHTPPVSENLPVEAVVSNDASVSGPDFFIGTVNAGAGVSIDLPKQRTIQMGLFYQKDLGGIGVEDQKFNIFGLKSSYWFRVR